jgi:hypothetical protein
MGTKEKLVKRFLSMPKDFTYNELKRFLEHFGYEELQAAGSRVIFDHIETGHKIKLYKPHPGNLLKHYQMDLIAMDLKSKGLI